MLCNFILYTFLSKVADTAETRNYLHVSYAAADGLREVGFLVAFLDDLPQILDLYRPIFQSYGIPRVIVDATGKVGLLPNYLGNFLRNPERSGLFHNDSGLWGTLVATRYMRYLGTRFDPR